MALANDVLTDLALSRGTLDRAAHRRADDGLLPRLLGDPATRVAVISADQRIALEDDPTSPTGRGLAYRAPVDADRAAGTLAVFLGEEGGTSYVAVVDPQPRAEDGWPTLRDAGLTLAPRDAGVFTTAQALANWHRAHPHCPRCGARTEPHSAGWVRRCTADGSEHYPRTDPAVIMGVLDDDERLLVGRSPAWPEGRFSVLAGFVEPGESFEAAVAREVREEVGIDVDEVTYLGNQPWPFPCSGMIGFSAHARSTELTLDPVEMAEARWFSRQQYVDALVTGELRVPGGISIAQRIIEHWLGARIEDAVAAAGAAWRRVEW
ncbi:NAD(+) diphosphatase [Lapillicoccus jejuensis]|uniref:NAD(+) diphosphatase n=1 Tax=Lapillicoccus jejuensis TaxID=402171 RepID=A0A542DW88_9MICO|nr:NAD(+) diphosphatase [Lapillicoccus jejuensis]TQJ07326.1 NAD+ diphosphatase [Lapillicoccus jejuensis]